MALPASSDQNAFNAKASSLIEATGHLSVPQILMARRMTLNDPESLRSASKSQLGVVFDVIIGNALKRIDRLDLLAAMDQNLEPLLPPDYMRDPDDYQILDRLVQKHLNKTPTSNRKLTDAEKVVLAFEKLLTRRFPVTPQRVNRHYPPFREPAPLFAQQGGMRATSALLPAAALAHVESTPLSPGGMGASPVDFTTLFDDTICNHIQSVFDQLQVPPDYPTPLARPCIPFMVSQEFTLVFEDVLRQFILPQVRESRQIKALANTYNWAQVGGDQLLEIIHGSEINNPILHSWDAVWNAQRAEEKEPKRKKNLWTIINEDAAKNNYTPPKRDHVRLLLDVIRYEPEAIEKCWREITSLSQQEFSPSGRQERARDGALRDGLLKWSAKLPDAVGEFVAIKAAFILPPCNRDYMRALLNNYGRNDQERRRNAPYLAQFVAEMTG